MELLSRTNTGDHCRIYLKDNNFYLLKDERHYCVFRSIDPDNTYNPPRLLDKANNCVGQLSYYKGNVRVREYTREDLDVLTVLLEMKEAILRLVPDFSTFDDWDIGGRGLIACKPYRKYRYHDIRRFRKPKSDRDVLVFGSNPEGRHSLGLARVARDHWRAKYGQGIGLQGQAYAIPTKNLTAWCVDGRGTVYPRDGKRSVDKSLIRDYILEMYRNAYLNPTLQFYIPYVRGAENLNGYSSREMIDIFLDFSLIPENIYFHESWKPILER